MSLESLSLVWAHSAAEGSALLALLAIADHDGDGGAWPSMDTIAQRARVTRDTARKLVRKLEALGEIRTDPNGGGGLRTAAHMRTNRYEITLDCPPECDRSARHRIRSGIIHTPLRAEGPPSGGDPAARRGTPQPHGGANHPLTTHLGNSVPEPEDSRGDDRDPDSADVVDEYAAWSLGQKIAEAARRAAEAEAQHKPIKRPDLSRGSGSRSMVPPAPKPPKFDPASVPPPQPPRSPEDDAAVAALHTQPSDHPHLIPATSTICLRCGTDARTLTRKATP